jgi:hypothetical protein
MTTILLLVLSTSCLWLGSLAASTVFLAELWRIRWSASLLLAYPLWWYSQLLVTKGLSLFGAINQRSLIIATCVFVVLPAAFTLFLKQRNRPPTNEKATGQSSQQIPSDIRTPRIAHNIRKVVRSYWPEGIAIIYVGLVIVAAALLYAPQIWDTYTYHLPMVANWLQQGSLSPWTTACLRQVTRAGGAEYQQLWVLGMPHVDLFAELPSILAGAISAVFVWEVAHRWGASRTVALSAGLSIFAVPQIVWATLSIKDDLIMTAGILCALYNAIASFSEPRKRLASFQAGAAAVAAALVCATKVPGFGFGSSFILLFALFLIRMRMWKRFWIVITVFVATSFPAFVIQYIHNLHQYGALYAESYLATLNPDPRHHAFGSGIIVSAYNIVKLLFHEPGKGVGPIYAQSNYGIWVSLVVLPLVAITNWSSMLGMLKRERRWSPTAVNIERLFVVLYLFLSIAVMLSQRTFVHLDQRFMVWVCPVLLVLGMRGAERYISPVLFRTLCLGFTILTVRSVLAAGFPATTGKSLSGTIEVRPTSYYLPGYEALSDATPGDTVLYVGGRRTAESPCWGWKYDRIVWAADSTATLKKFFARLPDWVVLEEEIPEDLRSATLELLSSQKYRLVSQDAASQAHLRERERRTIWRR